MLTRQLHKFHGGLRLPDHKEQSTSTPIACPPLPARLVVPLLQHAGPPATPCVKAGDPVYKGQLIGQADEALAVPVHAPTSGTVRSIAPMPYPHPSGEPCLAVEILADGLDQWQEPEMLRDPRQFDNQTLLKIIHDAGIAGMGGAGFPAERKLRGHYEIEYLIINGCECEPYISADDMLMRERSDSIMSGIDVLVQLLQPRQVLIAIEDNKPEAVAAMHTALQDRDYQLLTLPTLYPSGGERQLIKILTGLEVPSAGFPVDLGIICQNCATVAAIYNAVVLGRPLISRITTLTGNALKQPMNVECLTGTPIQELLEFAGLQTGQLDRIIAGGPMMGFVLQDYSAPVIKTTNCLIAASPDELAKTTPELPCIRCAECEQVCPSNLLPQQLLFFAKGRVYEQLMTHNLFDCIECGCCSHVCPSQIPLVHHYRAAKAEIRQQQHRKSKAEQAKKRFEQRQQRLQLEEEQKAAARKARNERLAHIKATQQPENKGKTSDDPNQNELKRLKIAASMAQVALNKAEKQLAQHGGESLQNQVSTLKQAAEKAQTALQAAEHAAAQTTVFQGNDSTGKKAKIQLAMQRAALKKAERAGADEKQLQILRQAVNQTEQLLQELSTPDNPARTP